MHELPVRVKQGRHYHRCVGAWDMAQIDRELPNIARSTKPFATVRSAPASNEDRRQLIRNRVVVGVIAVRASVRDQAVVQALKEIAKELRWRL
jgi:hypothetical protein